MLICFITIGFTLSQTLFFTNLFSNNFSGSCRIRIYYFFATEHESWEFYDREWGVEAIVYRSSRENNVTGKDCFTHLDFFTFLYALCQVIQLYDPCSS
jgi:hypothetical protein